MKKKGNMIYVGFFFVLCLIPSVGMLLPQTQGSATENRKLALWPQLRTEEGWNTDFLSEAGEYFQDHFGFRQQLVTANALINGKIFGVSTADGVIQGKNGWLYYKDSLSDYLGTEPMSERALFNVAHTLSMMQDYTEKSGAKFLFTIAPNKNTLYGENMPYYDSMIVSEDKNMDRIEAYLEKENVNYVNLKEILESSDEVLYHERDSHWNNKGAALAGDALMTALDKEHTDYTQESYEECVDFTGDLDEMLYPLALTEEKEIYYDKADVFAYVGEVESNFDPKITTVNPGSTGSLVMYRDSFGNAILPFFCKQLCKRLLFQRYPLSDDRSCGASGRYCDRGACRAISAGNGRKSAADGGTAADGRSSYGAGNGRKCTGHSHRRSAGRSG